MTDKIATILVTGSNGQLGSELKAIAATYHAYDFIFVSRNELEIDDFKAVQAFFNSNKISHCINCAAYTAVDKAETEPEKAFLINNDAVRYLALVCKTHNSQFIHISTDYVFDGSAGKPYNESDPTNPLGVYGNSKLKGEQNALQNNPSSIIIRTSWLYSSFGSNFVKTMLRLMKERESINVVEDQYGCPTYAADLANVIMQFIGQQNAKKLSGIFHYANSGITNWYEFALAIKNISGSSCRVNPINTAQYPTPARRPKYSVFDTTLIQAELTIDIPDWKSSLQKCLALLA